MHREGGWRRVSLLDNNSPCSLQCGWGFQSVLAGPTASSKFLRGGAWLYLLPSGETNPPPVHLLPFSFLPPAHGSPLLSSRELLSAVVLLFFSSSYPSTLRFHSRGGALLILPFDTRQLAAAGDRPSGEVGVCDYDRTE